jgi:hypothetical protein
MLSPAEFREIVAAHEVLSGSLKVAAASLGLIEAGIGFAIVAAGGGARRICVLLPSLLLLAVVSAYLAFVPAEVLSSVGCGCGLGRSNAGGYSWSWINWGANFIMAALHVPLLLGVGRPLYGKRSEERDDCLLGGSGTLT